MTEILTPAELIKAAIANLERIHGIKGAKKYTAELAVILLEIEGNEKREAGRRKEK